ncbi:hypothetical protein ACIQU5_28255 [Streptomyces sp. NPDC090306]|uniref:hypothetical protein n=1 Tax=unclassified Streptomyces TaxID=2593676 RepID=UPI0036E2859D
MSTAAGGVTPLTRVASRRPVNTPAKTPPTSQLAGELPSVRGQMDVTSDTV